MGNKGKGKGRKKQATSSAPADPIREWEITEPVDAAHMMKAFQQIGETGRELKNLRKARKDLNSEIGDKQGQLNALLEEAETLKTKRFVKVKEVPDFDKKEVRIVRTDMDENDPDAVVSRRQMTGGELQAGSVLTPSQAGQTLAKVAAAAGEKPKGEDAFNFTGDEPPPAVTQNPGVVEGLQEALQN